MHDIRWHPPFCCGQILYVVILLAVEFTFIYGEYCSFDNLCFRDMALATTQIFNTFTQNTGMQYPRRKLCAGLVNKYRHAAFNWLACFRINFQVNLKRLVFPKQKWIAYIKT